jgi:MFS superfamily sulfate permease-like transporter
LAFALTVYNGFPVPRLFILWGIIYIAAALYFRVPVSVQPLKAMVVLAVTYGYSMEFLSSSAIFYGILFIILTYSGLIRIIDRFFSQDLIRGIQLGVGLMLGKKAAELVMEHALFLGGTEPTPFISAAITFSVVATLIIGLSWMRKPVAIIIIIAGLITAWLMGIVPETGVTSGKLIVFSLPNLRYLSDAFILLIIPQLPLTLGNSVFAANDAIHEFWPDRNGKTNTSRLAGSIGISNIFIGMFGGFPICHGAGGLAAHARLGARTGGATIIMGFGLILLSLVDNWSILLFMIPIPILSGLLIYEIKCNVFTQSHGGSNNWDYYKAGVTIWMDRSENQ